MGRYWNTFEILRSYYRYLVSFYRELADVEKILKCVKEYTRFLIDQKKSFYTSGYQEIEEFKKYLANKKYNNRYYSPKFLAWQLYRIRHFYDWGVQKGIFLRHPFPQYQYYQAIEEFRQKLPRREVSRRYPIKIPEKYESLVQDLEDYERAKTLDPWTTRIHKRGWSLFFEFLEKKEINDVYSITAEQLISYQQSLLYTKDTRGKFLSNTERSKRLTAVKWIYRYLVKKGILKSDPTVVLELPRYNRALPKELLTPRELSRIISAPDSATLLGLRDRTIMEVIYSTGIRTGELVGLDRKDVDFEKGFIRVNHPKGGPSFQRIIPIGQIALDFIRRYLKESLSQRRNFEEALFVSYKGIRIKKLMVYNMVRNYCAKAGIRKNITPHCFRIACATDMLRRGADIRYVQTQLGHHSLQSTQVYARVVPTDLKRIHRLTHPRESKRKVVLALSA